MTAFLGYPGHREDQVTVELWIGSTLMLLKAVDHAFGLSPEWLSSGHLVPGEMVR